MNITKLNPVETQPMQDDKIPLAGVISIKLEQPLADWHEAQRTKLINQTGQHISVNEYWHNIAEQQAHQGGYSRPQAPRRYKQLFEEFIKFCKTADIIFL